MAQVLKDFFIYSTGNFDVAAAATTTQTIAIQADSAFELEQLTFSCAVAGAAITNETAPIPNATILITDNGSGRQLMNVAVPMVAFFGDGRLPFKLPIPRVLAPRATIQITITSFEAVNTNTISINLIGNKIYSLG